MIGQTISHYRILQKLGESGMGVVYLAEDTRLGRRVAIKFPTSTDEHFRSRFLREARALSNFNHPNIATVHDYGETADGRPFIVMEYIKGQDLSALLEHGLTLAQAIEYAATIAEALSEAHARGIVHRDIKPSNVIINDRGLLKVIDFGLAKQLHDEPSVDGGHQPVHFTQTRSDVMVGTPLYLSPEQATGKPIDGRSDLFSLGGLLYECVSGRLAFSGENPIEIAAQVIHVSPPSPATINPGIPAALDRIIMKALEKNVDDRYQSAEEMAKDLREMLATLSVDSQQIRRQPGAPTSAGGALRTSALATLTETLRRPRISLVSVLIGIVVLAGALVVWAIVRERRSAPHVPSGPARAAYDRGVEALRNGAFLQAEKAFEQAIGIDDKFALAHARLAEALTQLDYSDRAKDELLRVHRLADTSTYPELERLRFEAINATVTRDFGIAIAAYKRIAELNSGPEAYADLGHAYEDNDDIKNAIENYVKATNAQPQYASAFLRLGYLYGRQLDLASAEAALGKAEELYRSQNNLEGLGEVFYCRGQLFNQLNKLAEARAQLQKALDTARVSNSEYQRIRTLLQLSSVADTEGNKTAAQAYAHQAIELAQANGMESQIANGLIDLGNVFFSHGEYDEAEKYFNQSLDYARNYKMRRIEARALLTLGSLRLQGFGDPDKTLLYTEQALPFYKSGNYRKQVFQALILINRANSLKGNYDEALKALTEELQLAEQAGDLAQVSQTHGDMGVIAVRREQYPEALEHFQKNGEINKSLGNQQGVGYSLTNRGNVLWQLGRYTEARSAFADALTIADRPDGKFQGLLAWLLLTRARMSLSEGRYKDAETEAMQSAKAAGAADSSRAAETKSVLGLAQVLSGNKANGKRECVDAFGIATRLNNQDLLCTTQLVLAEALLEGGDAEGAKTNALEAQARSNRLGKQDSEWHAWLFAARASQLGGDRAKAVEYASHAPSLLSALEQKWGAESYHGFQTRPDVQRYNKQLRELLPEGNK